MKLRVIAEIQRKWPTTNMDRANSVGTYAVGSVLDYLHHVHDGDGHAQSVSGDANVAANSADDDDDSD